MILQHSGAHRVAIVGDIHLHLRSKDFKMLDWETSRFLRLFVVLAESDADIILLNGDTFNTANATLEEIAVLYEGLGMLAESGKVVYLTEGNHEELKNGKTTFSYLPHTNFTLLKVAELSFPSVTLAVVGHPYLDTILSESFPFTKDSDKDMVLVSHYRSDIGIADEEIDNSAVSAKYDRVVLSDIHYRLYPASNISYTSSPYGIHMKPKQDYGYTLVDIREDSYEIVEVPLHLPSKERVDCKLPTLQKTLDRLDKANRYNLVVHLESPEDSTTQALGMLKEASEYVVNFSLEVPEVLVTKELENITTKKVVSLPDTMKSALAELDSSDVVKDRALQIVKEELS